MQIKPVILSGGRGTRLWPISRSELPKQFSSLFGNDSLLDITIQRLTNPLLGDEAEIVIVGAEEHRFLLRDSLIKNNCEGSIILEPKGKNTAAAIAVSALLAKSDDLLLICPSDHFLDDSDYFVRTVLSGIQIAIEGAVVTFGVRPKTAATGYGYIEGKRSKDSKHNFLEVQKFVEKPPTEQALRFLKNPMMFWNAGILLVKAGTILSLLEKYAPDILVSCEVAMAKKNREDHRGITFIRPDESSFLNCRSDSIDYAVLQKCESVIKVIPYESDWRDLGSWEAVAQLAPSDERGNQVIGKGVVRDANNVYLRSDDRFVAIIGAQDLFVVDTSDAVLIVKKGHTEKVKDVVDYLSKNNNSVAATHPKVFRPWGWYNSIARGEKFQVKHIKVEPGEALSLQSHQYRSEHWIVVKGVAKVTKDDTVITLSANESTYIPKGARHRLENPGSCDLEIVEVQTGDYVGEDDIIRYDDIYGRKDVGEQ